MTEQEPKSLAGRILGYDPAPPKPVQPWYAWVCITIMFIFLLATITVLVRGWPV